MRHKGWIIALGVVALVVTVVVAGVLLFDWNMLKGYASRKITEATGREATIGDIHVDLAWTPRITIDGIRLANASWSDDRTMLAIDRLTFTLRLAALLRGRIDLPEVSLDRPQVLLERRSPGEANWELHPAAQAAAPKERSAFPLIGRLDIKDGTLVYRDAVQGIDISSHVNTVVGQGAEGGGGVELSGNGTLAGRPFDLAVQGGDLLTLRDESKPYPIRARAAVGGTRAELSGTLMQPFDPNTLDVDVTVRGPNVGELFPIVGIPAPDTPPYHLAGRLHREGKVWRFSDFSGTVGQSDVSGTLTADMSGERMKVTGDLVSQRIRLADLGLAIGLPTGIPKDESATEQQRRAARRYAASNRVLPRAPIDFKRVRSADADITFHGASIEGGGLPLQDLSGRLTLDNGLLRLDPIEVGAAGGTMQGTLSLDARRDTVVSQSNIRLRGFRLERALGRQRGAGEVIGRARLTTTGNSIAAAAANADGELSLLMHGGRFSKLAVELIGLQIAEALGLAVTGDEPVAIRCAVATFGVKDGIMTSRALVFDTTDSNITGSGSVNLRDETVALTLEAHPKSPGLFSARAPIRVTGTFKSVHGYPDPVTEGARAGAAAALGVLLTPLGAALAFLDPGLGKDSDCAALIDRAESVGRRGSAPEGGGSRR